KRSGSTGVYAEDTQTIHWLVTTGSSAYLHNTELIYDTVLDSFYKFKYNTEILYKPLYIQTRKTALPEYTLSRSLFYIGVFSGFVAKFVSPQPDVLEGPSFNSNAEHIFEDYTGDPVEAFVPAFMQTGYINGGDSQRMKQCQYIIPSFLR